MLHLKQFAVLVALLFISGSSPGWSANDCGHCLVKQNALADLQRAEAEYQELLKKNHDMMARLPASDTSKAIKLRSNITMINIKLESVRDNILSAHVEIEKQCKDCRGDQ